MEDKPETPQPGEQTPPSDEILQSIGLSREDYESAKADKQEDAHTLAELFGKGRQYYLKARDMWYNYGGVGAVAEIDLGIAKFEPRVEQNRGIRPQDIADVALKKAQELKSSQPELATKIDRYLTTFLAGYAEDAFAPIKPEPETPFSLRPEKRVHDPDWLTAINTIDAITEGGIMTNKDFLARIKEVTGGDNPNGDQISERSKIAEMLEIRVSQTKKAPVMANTTELRPAPPKPGDPRLN